MSAQVALLAKENKKISGHLKAAQSARAAAQRAASQLKQENAALTESRDTAAVRRSFAYTFILILRDNRTHHGLPIWLRATYADQLMKLLIESCTGSAPS